VVDFPYTEDFENGGVMADCWMQEYVLGAINWTVNTGNHNPIAEAHGGAYNAYFYHASQTNNTTKLISPIFDLTNLSSPYVTYWYSKQAWGNDQDFLTVYYRTSPSAPWQQLQMYTTSVETWTKDSLLLPNPSATYQIAFEGLANYGNGITLDDITVNGTIDTTVVPDPCEVPTGLHAVSVENHAISIAWDANPNVGLWNIQYRPVGDSWSSVTASTNSYTLTNLEGLTSYEIRVQANCGYALSEWSPSITEQTTNVGIESYLENSVSLYPNPANDVVNVQCTMNNVQTVEVIDVYGKLINTLNVTDNPTKINVSRLAAGLYFVRVTTQEGTVTKSFVKQ
jgi:hypothetical protein